MKHQDIINLCGERRLPDRSPNLREPDPNLRLPRTSMQNAMAGIVLAFALISPSAHSQVIDSIDALELKTSPYYCGDTAPATLRQTSINLESLSWILGYHVGVAGTPSREEYFRILKRALAISIMETQNDLTNTLHDIDEIFKSASPELKEAKGNLQALTTELRREQMRAVRNRNGERASILYGLYKRCSMLERASGQLDLVLNTASTTIAAIKIVAAAAGPFRTYDDTRGGIEALLRYGNDLSPDLAGAMRDVISLIDNEKTAFLANLRNSGEEVWKVAIDAGLDLSKTENVQKLFRDHLGSKNYDYMNEFFAAREFIQRHLGKHSKVSELATMVQPVFTMAAIDVAWHKLVFQKIKENDSIVTYFSAYRILLLIESVYNDGIAQFLGGASHLSDSQSAIDEARRLSKNAILTFNNLDIGF